jgi:hypothetical protein
MGHEARRDETHEDVTSAVAFWHPAVAACWDSIPPRPPQFVRTANTHTEIHPRD